MAREPVFCLVDQNLKDLIGHHFEYDRVAVQGAQARGFKAVCLGHRDAIEVVANALPLRRTFTRSMWWLPDAADREQAIAQANSDFLAEVEAGVADLDLNASSVVFAHMIVHGQMSAWAHFVEQRCLPEGPQVVLLLRYQPSFYQGAGCEAAFRSLERSVAKGARVRLASDSARLSGQLERLTSLPVETFPIPHTSEAHGGAVRAPGPLRIVSLGNARDEKGILELFDAARLLQLRGDGAGLEFVLQVNHPNAEIAPAIDRFVQDPPPNVRLIRDALPTDAYAELLASADIVATPYWRGIYEARTSGVFLEAVAAGKPVVCTQQTWMADELARAGAGVLTRDRDPAALAMALVEARDRFAELSAKAMADRPKWRAFHNPDRFAGILLYGAPATPRPVERRVAVMFPWGDDLVDPATGAARRVKPMIDLLATRYTAVRVLQDVDRAPRRVGPVSYEPDPMLQRAEGRRWFKLARSVLRALGARHGQEIYALLHLAPSRDAEFRARVDEMVAWADLVLLEYPFWAEIVRQACDRHGKRLVVTAHDVISDQCRGAPLVQAVTRTLERRALGAADRRFALSRADAEVFTRWGLPTRWSPIGLDLDLLRTDIPGDSRALLNHLCGWPKDDHAPLLLFMGSNFRPNVVAAGAVAEMAATFERCHPDLEVRFVVAGACHPPQAGDRFTALGYVEAVTAHLLRRHCTLTLAPLTMGTGVSLKTCEALASAAALLSTSVGVRGIDGAAAAAEVEDNLSAWPDRIAALLKDTCRLADLRRSCREVGDAMDYRRLYVDYLAEGGVADTPALGNDPALVDRRKLLVEAAQAAIRLQAPATAQACLAAVLEVAPADSFALIARARLLAEAEGEGVQLALQALNNALRQGAEPVAVLRAHGDILADRDGSAAQAAWAEAARFRASSALSEGGEPGLRQEMWDAYHAGDASWALALACEIARHWPSLAEACGDYDYVCADLLGRQESAEALEAAGTHARRAHDRGFDGFWTQMVLAGLLGRRGASEDERLAAYEAAATFAGLDAERVRSAVDAIVGVGWERLGSGDLVGAREAAQRGTAKRRTSGGLYLLAEATRLEGAWTESLSLYQKAEHAGADAGWCRTHQAELLLKLGQNDEAIRCGLAALAAPGEVHRQDATGVVCDGVWRFYESGEPEGEAAVRLAVDAQIADGRIWYVQGELLRRQQRHTPALEAYGRALDLGFDAYWGFRRRAEAKAALGLDDADDRLAAAAAAVDQDLRYAAIAPMFTRRRLDGLSEAHRVAALQLCPDERRRAEMARALDAEAAKPAPARHGSTVDAAWRAFEGRDYTRTLELAHKVLARKRSPSVRLAHGHYLIAECLQILRRDMTSAEDHYARALELGFEAYWAHFNRGQLRLKLGDEAGGREDLAAAAEVTDDPAKRQAALDSLAALD